MIEINVINGGPESPLPRDRTCIQIGPVYRCYAPGEEIPPTVVKNWQMRRALNAAGLRNNVEAIVAQAPQDMKDMWDYSPDVERAHPFVEQMRQALGLTVDQVDQLFVAANAIVS